MTNPTTLRAHPSANAWIARSRTWFLRNVALPTGDIAFGQATMKRLRFLEQAQWWDNERLEAERNRLLSKVIAVAYRDVPLYRDLMNQSGLKPQDIRSARDLGKLPVMTKDTLRNGFPSRTTRPTGQRTYEARTSGSTGQNFVVLEDARTKGWYLASFLLALDWAGWKIGDAHMQTGMTLQRNVARKLKDYFLRCHYVSAFDLDDRRLDIALELLDQKKIEHVWGYAASLYFLALRAKARGWNRPLRSVVTWGDNLYPMYRQAVETAFRTPVFDTYGVGEGIQVSAQCGHSHNYHVHMLDVIVEYLDDEGRPAPLDHPGNLILTRLHAGPMPLIRYRVGDVGVAGDQSPCGCGRGFDRMRAIQGRDTDVVLTPSGNRLIVEFFNGIIDDFPEIQSFQVLQERLDSIVVTIVPRPGYSERTRRNLVAAMQRNGAGDLHVEVATAQEIPLTPGGKRRYVISKVANFTPRNGTTQAAVR